MAEELETKVENTEETMIPIMKEDNGMLLIHIQVMKIK